MEIWIASGAVLRVKGLLTVKILLKPLRWLRTVINGKLLLTLISFLGSLSRTCTRLFYGLYLSSEPDIALSLGFSLLSSAANSSISSTFRINCAAQVKSPWQGAWCDQTCWNESIEPRQITGQLARSRQWGEQKRFLKIYDDVFRDHMMMLTAN
jgi:hypothetical protein